MTVGVVVRFIAKTTVRVVAYVYDEDGDLVDPTGSIKVTMTDPDATKKVDAQDMTKQGDLTGTYEYFYNTTTSSVEGWWTGEVVVVDGSGEGAKTSVDRFAFEVIV